MKKTKDGMKGTSKTKEERRRSEKRKDKTSHRKRKAVKSDETELENVDISDIDFDDETLESLPNQYKPIWVFMDNRKEMVEQIFSTVQHSSLQTILPNALKHYNFEQIKTMCLEQLTTMSEDYILYILTGGDPDAFIEKSRGDSEQSIEGASTGSIKHKHDEQLVSGEGPGKRSAIDAALEVPSVEEEDDEPSSEALELYANPREIRNLDEDDSVLSTSGKDEDPIDPELLELELRAKAIRALLRTKGFQSSDEEGKY